MFYLLISFNGTHGLGLNDIISTADWFIIRAVLGLEIDLTLTTIKGGQPRTGCGYSFHNSSGASLSTHSTALLGQEFAQIRLRMRNNR